MLLSKKSLLFIIFLFFSVKGYCGEINFAQKQLRISGCVQQLHKTASDSLGDSWFSSDKGLHFIGGMISTVSVGKSMQRFAKTERKKSIMIGAGFTISLGLAKEAFDSLQPKNIFSYKDLLADCLGIAIGIILLRAH